MKNKKINGKMLIGICIKKNDIYYYSKPLILNLDMENNNFRAQLIRDMDYSLILLENDHIILDILIYPDSKSYINANLKNLESNKFKKLGTYHIIIENIIENNQIKFGSLRKGNFKKLLDSFNDLIIDFNTIKRFENEEYIFSIPYITGKINYLNYF